MSWSCRKAGSQEIAERRMAEMGLDRHIVLRSQHFMSVPHLVATSDIISIVPRAVGRAFMHTGRLKLLEPPFKIPSIELKQFWHRRVHTDPGVLWLRNLIARLYLNRDPSETAHSPIFGGGGGSGLLASPKSDSTGRSVPCVSRDEIVSSRTPDPINRRIIVQHRHCGRSARQNGALVDVALVGDFAAVDRGGLGQEQRARRMHGRGAAALGFQSGETAAIWARTLS